MNKISTQELTDLGKKWFVVLIWALILLILVQTVGIAIHEFGHYSVGRLFGCNNLSISIAKLSIQDSYSNVSGWEYCKTPLVMAKDGSRICNLKTNIDSFAGLGFSLLVFIPLLIFINGLFKRKFKKGYLSGHFFAVILIFVIVMAIKSASWDLFKIGECLVNTQFGNMIITGINILQAIILPLLIIIFFIIDIIQAMNVIFKEKNKK